MSDEQNEEPVSGAIDTVRGMRDTLPADQQMIAQAKTILEAQIAAHGYLSVDLPVIEARDLYLRKLGEELVGKIYEFRFGGRDLALRPEWTASVLRAYVAHLQDQPLPVRLAYSGPVFRYERPQRHTYRQFSQVGGELIGGLAPRADAEVIAVACAGLDALAIRDYRVIIGHVGLVRSLLGQFDLAERTRSLLIWSIEHLRSRGMPAVQQRISEQLGAPTLDFALPEDLSDEAATRILQRVFEATRVELNSGTRSPEAIVARLLRKLRRADSQPQIEQALALLDRVAAIRGVPSEALPAMAAILAELGLTAPAFGELKAILDLLSAHGISDDRVIVDFGLGRGLHYYSGMIFVIYCILC